MVPISQTEKLREWKQKKKTEVFRYFNIWDFVDSLKSIIYYKSGLICLSQKVIKSVQNLQNTIRLHCILTFAIVQFLPSFFKVWQDLFFSISFFSFTLIHKISSPLFSLLTEHNSREEFATQTKSRNEEKAIRRNDFIYHSCCLLCFDELFNNCARIHFRQR